VDGNDVTSVDADAVRTLAGVLGLAVPAEDVEALAGLFAAQVLPALDLLGDEAVADAEPAGVFDPRWDR
jgi:hypothetical protein